jgi:hypothetical protein
MTTTTTKPSPKFLDVLKTARDTETLPDYVQGFYSLTNAEQTAIRAAYKKVRTRAMQKSSPVSLTRGEKARVFLRVAKTRRLTASLIKTRFKWLEVFENSHGWSFHRATQPDALRREIGKNLKRWERLTAQQQQQPKSDRLCDRLPLYACSGELEATALHPSGTRYRRAEFWDVGRDGGGQHEIRFRIASNLPETACRIVSRLGGPTKNGGHVHMNCKADEPTGERVFSALRFHICWFRFLTPHARRQNRFCGVRLTPTDFSRAKTVKFAAISANTWKETGTVEVRIWPTSKNPKDWHFRARFMRSIAKWSETRTVPQFDAITLDVGHAAWRSFFEWAALYDPATLRETLSLLKRRARQTADRRAQECCEAFVEAFDLAGIPLRGYRRQSTPTPETPSMF